MALTRVQQGGTLRDITQVKVMDGGVLRTVSRIRVMAAGAMQTVYQVGGTPPPTTTLAVTAEPGAVQGGY